MGKRGREGKREKEGDDNWPLYNKHIALVMVALSDAAIEYAMSKSDGQCGARCMC